MTSTYRIEFGPAWPVPPVTVDFTDRTTACTTVARHAIPHLQPALAQRGHPEWADCLFRVNRQLTVGEFVWINVAEVQAAWFCPARLTPLQDDTTTGEGA